MQQLARHIDQTGKPVKRNSVLRLGLALAMGCMPYQAVHANLLALCHDTRLVSNASMDSSVLIDAVPNDSAPDGWSMVNSPDRVDVGVVYEPGFMPNPFALTASPDGGSWVRLVDNASDFREEIYQQINGLRPGSNFYVRYYQSMVIGNESPANGHFDIKLGDSSIEGVGADRASSNPAQGTWSEEVVGPFVAKFENEKLSIAAVSTTVGEYTDLFLDGVTVCSIDADNDGIPNVMEDANGDGVFTNDDTDGDGVPDYLDTDSDNDGLIDRFEASVSGSDGDGDGLDDTFDADFIGDGDENGDGISDASFIPQDSDTDGIPDYIDFDSDDDGVPDMVEGKSDSDGDNIENYLDTDSDNDGIPDRIEGGASGLDDDLDGIDNAYDNDSGSTRFSGTPPDSEGDGIPDMFDVDSDNDGLPDALEGTADGEGDGFPNYRDLDSDNDSFTDFREATPFGTPLTDSDNDGIIDFFDRDQAIGTDSNNDGVVDSASLIQSDQDGLADPYDPDSDGDGVPDIIEGLQDTDRDGIPNFRDLDSDNDGISDTAEGNVSGFDSDGDGIDDNYDVDHTAGPDSNEDGIDDSVFPPDNNLNLIPDMMEMQVVNMLITGTRGSGCSISGLSTTNQAIDPILGLLLMGALAGVGRRAKRHTVAANTRSGAAQ